MLRNVLEVDFASHKISIRSRSGAMILFDFKAAFPSLAHEMIWDVLEATGVDTDFIRVVKAFYRNNKHLLKFRSIMFEGCPLSGLIFAICVDVLITRLNGILKRDEVVDAFADDIAVVVDNFWVSAPVLEIISSSSKRYPGSSLTSRRQLWFPCGPMGARLAFGS